MEDVRSQNISDNFRVTPFLWVIPFILTGIGILMITSTTSTTSFASTGTPFQMGMKQLQWFFLAVISMLLVYLFPLKFWYNTSGFILITTWIMSWVPLFFGTATAVGGARRWIQIPGMGISFQPGELLCLAMALHLAKIQTRTSKDPLKAFISTCILMFFAVLPLLFQPDFGSAMLLFLICMGMYVERVGWKYPIFAGGVIAGVAVPSLVFGKVYRMRRVLAFIDPWADPLKTGFQAIQGLIAFANGGFWGSGLGHGYQKLNYLPAAYTDFIYAAIGEELGLIGTLGVLGLFAFWISRVRRIYYKVHSEFNASLTWGIALTVILPLFINIAGVTKFSPMTGMPLPFVSYGGTSLLTMWARVGILMRLERESSLEVAPL